jgi:type IV pilus assembly protein PilC
MEVLGKITENEVYKKLIYDTAKNLTKGETISLAFKDHWAFPNIAYQMLITGEKTGRLGPMMERVSDYYQEQHRNIINQMKSLIEPVLIVTLAVVVGGILLAVILPMYGMYDSL